jgi:transcriptional regulator with XRE-family HTH domain
MFYIDVVSNKKEHWSKNSRKMTQNSSIYLQRNIRYLRKKHNLSQEELAAKVGLNRGNIASYENGTAEPKLCNLLKISNLFQVSILTITEENLSELNTALVKLNGNHHSEADSKEAYFYALEQHLAKAEELQTVVSSLYNCHCFKLKNLETQDRNTQVLISNFEQLYEITHKLLHSHRELLQLVNTVV